MSYFQKHAPRHLEPENIRPTQPRIKKGLFSSKPEQESKATKGELNQLQILNALRGRQPLQPKKQKEVIKPMAERDLSGFMLEGQNSMEQLLNSSINQFTKYLSDRDSIEVENQHLVAQNKSLIKTLEKLKIIIKQKLVSALSKQRQELNAVMEDYVQLITKLLADKEELTANLEKRESDLAESEQKNELLQKINQEAQIKVEQLGKEREQHISKTKQQIDDFLQIIQQYEEQAEQEAKETDELKSTIAKLEQQLEIAKKNPVKIQNYPQKTQDLLSLLEKAQEQNKQLRIQFNEQKRGIEREHEEQFIEYERAMQETIDKKDECIAHLKTIIDTLKSQRGKDKDSTFAKTIDLDISRQ